MIAKQTVLRNLSTKTIMRKVATRTTLRNQAGVIEYRPLNFSDLPVVGIFLNVRPFHENQNSLRAKPNRLSARWRRAYCSLLRLFARNHGGEFVLRIEDTDLERSTPEAIEAIMDGMNWLSLEWDEGPLLPDQTF